MTLTITIDGQPCAAEKGEFILNIARRNGIFIPTLCHSSALPEQACCRLCVVEIIENGWSKIVVSCVYPVDKDIEVQTKNEKILARRRMTLALLRASTPEAAEIAQMCRFYQVPEQPRFITATERDNQKCLVCGLCARACAALGNAAISTVGRGSGKYVSTPYEQAAEDCIGCGSCAEVCPTGAIVKTESNGMRHIWNKDFPLAVCPVCGAAFATEQELALAVAKGELTAEDAQLCPECRKKRIAAQFRHAYGVAAQ